MTNDILQFMSQFGLLAPVQYALVALVAVFLIKALFGRN